MNDDTLTTRILNTARENWRGVLSGMCAMFLAVVTISAAFGRYQGNIAHLADTVDKLSGHVETVSGQVEELSKQTAVTNALLQDLQRRVTDQEDRWDRVGDTADNFRVPHFGHRRE